MNQIDILDEIGHGSFANVYRIFKKPQNSYYALKKIQMKSLTDREKNNALNEIRLLASIDSPNIIKYKSAFFQQKDNSLCLVMQYADGGDLASLIKRKKQKEQKIREPLVWKIIFDILKGLKFLHENKIIHRDIKPGNIFIASGMFKLGDMNVSKVLDNRFAKTTAGTPYYISPQIWNGNKYDYKSDIWSFGCLIYEICMLKPPFMASDFPTLIQKIKSGYYVPIHTQYSRKLAWFIKKCLTTDPKIRPSAQELLEHEAFRKMKKTQLGQIQLLEPIQYHQTYDNLNKILPQKRYSKKLVTMKVLETEQNEEKQKQQTIKQKFLSQKHISMPMLTIDGNCQKQSKKKTIIKHSKSPMSKKKFRVKEVLKLHTNKLLI